jgi:cytochrome c biogenesis protein CcmG, thiol:disulfide interchange protein DsbE
VSRILARVIFLVIAAALLGGFAVYAINGEARAQTSGRLAPLYAGARAIRPNEKDAPNFKTHQLVKDPPPLALPDLEGKTHSLQEYKGKVVFLNFWASWCDPCKEEWPGMQFLAQELAQEYGDEFVMVAVSVEENDADVVSFLKENGMARSVVILRDKGEKTARSFGATGWPESFILGRDGKILHHFVGPRNWDSREAFTYLRAVISREKS